MPALLISLDFELFWGVTDARSLTGYRNNIEGVWNAIPKILELFRRYSIRATWATVGMLMCRDYAQWRDTRPSVLPAYKYTQRSVYSLESIAYENPKFFFAQPLVTEILETPGQEIASHSYSHFYCRDPGATTEQFAADLVCASAIGAEIGLEFKSFVFPRNQVEENCLIELGKMGYQVFRGNADHWLYREGHNVDFGYVGRGIRLVDAYLPISGNHTAKPSLLLGLINIPASLSLRPWSQHLTAFEPLRLLRLKSSMTEAAVTDRIFHLWWHPHNFGVNIEENIAVLASLLQHYQVLRNKYGMRSVQMADFSKGVQL